MITRVVNAVIVGIVLVVVYLLLEWAVAAIGVSVNIMPFVAIILILAYCLYLLRLFNVTT